MEYYLRPIISQPGLNFAVRSVGIHILIKLGHIQRYVNTAVNLLYVEIKNNDFVACLVRLVQLRLI